VPDISRIGCRGARSASVVLNCFKAAALVINVLLSGVGPTTEPDFVVGWDGFLLVLETLVGESDFGMDVNK